MTRHPARNHHHDKVEITPLFLSHSLSRVSSSLSHYMQWIVVQALACICIEWPLRSRVPFCQFRRCAERARERANERGRERAERAPQQIRDIDVRFAPPLCNRARSGGRGERARCSGKLSNQSSDSLLITKTIEGFNEMDYDFQYALARVGERTVTRCIN